MTGAVLIRGVLGALGAGLGLYGAWLLYDRQDLDQLTNLGTWLVVGVIVHDALVSAVVVVVGLLVARALPRPARAPAAVGAVVLGSVTMLAIPVLGRFGARFDNPSLLDRDYLAGWAGFAAVVGVTVVMAAVVRGRQAREEISADDVPTGGLDNHPE